MFVYRVPVVLCLIADGQAVKRNREEYGIPLQIVTYEDLYGWTMDNIVKAVGKKSNCTGVFRQCSGMHLYMRALTFSCRLMTDKNMCAVMYTCTYTSALHDSQVAV